MTIMTMSASRALLALLASALLGAAFYASRPAAINKDGASNLLERCMRERPKRCYIKDDTTWEMLAGQRFELTGSNDPPDPGSTVVDYEFASPDGRYCALVEFGKGALDYNRTAEFYQCGNRANLTLGIG
jgi:hypothetical protein